MFEIKRSNIYNPVCVKFKFVAMLGCARASKNQSFLLHFSKFLFKYSKGVSIVFAKVAKVNIFLFANMLDDSHFGENASDIASPHRFYTERKDLFDVLDILMH